MKQDRDRRREMSELQNKANLKSKIKIQSNFSDITTTNTKDSDMLASLSVEKAGLGHRLNAKQKNDMELFPSAFGPSSSSLTTSLTNRNTTSTTTSLASRLRMNGKKSTTSSMRDQAVEAVMYDEDGEVTSTEYIISKDNSEEWSQISDDLALAMLSIYVEREVASMVSIICVLVLLYVSTVYLQFILFYYTILYYTIHVCDR